MISGNGSQNEPRDTFQEAIRLLQQGRAKEAAALLEPLYRLKPNDPELALNLGGAYILQRRYNRAEALLSKAVKLAPDHANLWVNLAAARLGALEMSNQSQQDGAIEAYQKALEIDPQIANVYYMLGLVYRQRKDMAQAEVHFRRALEQDPNDRDASLMLRRIKEQK